MENTGTSNQDMIFDGMRAQDLQHVLSRVTDELVVAVGADNAFVYWVTPNQTFIPLMANAMILENERTLFFNHPLDPATDMLAYQVLSQRNSIVSNRVQSDKRVIPSILSLLQTDTAMAIPVLSHGLLIGLVLVTRKGRFEPFTVVQTRVAEAISLTIALAIENVRLYQETRSRLVESQSLHQVTVALLQKLELDEVLEIVCTEAQHLTGALGSSIALLESEDWLRIMYCTGEVTDRPGRVAVSQSMLGLAVRRNEPLIINNHAADLSGSDSTGPTSLLALPLIVQNKIIGVLDVVNKTHGFTQDDVRIIQLFANEAAIAVDNARLARQVQEMAVVEERHRLSRELHDSVNQLLYGISLYSQAAQRKLEQGDLDSVRKHINQLSQSAQEALNEMRLLIFELRPKLLDQLGLQEALAQRLKSVEERLGLEAAFKWRVTAVLDKKVEEAIYGIAQEALNNVIKHSKAQNVTIHLIQSGQTLLMKIEDDGVGFDFDQIGEGGLGLKTMQERAQSLHADLTIHSAPGKGTHITVEVKL